MTSIRTLVQTLRPHNRRIISVTAGIIGLTGAAVVWAAFGNPLAIGGVSGKATQVIARVNGAPISRAAFERVWAETREQSRMLEMQENRQVVLDSVVGAELLAQQARNDSQVMADAQLQAAMEMQTRNLLANAYVNEFLRRNPASDTVLKAAYDQLLKDLGKNELHLRHVLLAKQDDAKALHDRIARNELSFAKALELTEEKTQDGKKGTGDLGWLAEGRMSAPLKASVAAAKGAGLLEPFGDQYGWHVVQVEETRPLKAPAFEEVRGELIPIAQRTLLRDHLAKIKASASINS
jgi:peptidyl-prolyl cis-trans isomerase C